MRNYNQEKELTEVLCNCCGKHLKLESGIIKEGCFQGNVTWGYFSRKDGLSQNFDLCEDCFEKITGKFHIPVKEQEVVELLS